MNIENIILSGVTSMTVKPFFSVGFSASSMPTSCEGFDSTLRNAEGKARSPVPSVPVNIQDLTLIFYLFPYLFLYSLSTFSATMLIQSDQYVQDDECSD